MSNVAAGYGYSLVLLEGGELWSAGPNNHGQLGIGNNSEQKSFVQVDLKDKNVVSVAAGIYHS